MTAPITNEKTKYFFCLPLRRKKKIILSKESVHKASTNALETIRDQTKPVDIPGSVMRVPSQTLHVEGIGELDLDRISSVTTAASSLQRSDPVDGLRTEAVSDLRNGFYWKQNADGTWSILPK